MVDPTSIIMAVILMKFLIFHSVTKKKRKKDFWVGNGRMVFFPSYIPWLNHLISFVVFSCCVVFACQKKKLNHFIHLCRRIALHYKFISFKMDCHWDIFFVFIRFNLPTNLSVYFLSSCICRFFFHFRMCHLWKSEKSMQNIAIT